jgi:nicotinamidase-related amidase
MGKVLVVVDMQNDFIDGVLGTKEASAILPEAVSRIKAAKEAGYEIVLTMDTHDTNYFSSQESKFVPVAHCVEGEYGWQLNSDIAAVTQGDKVFKKSTFASTRLADYLKSTRCEEVEIIGVCTDICVICNAIIIKTLLPETPVIVNSSCCAGTTKKAHNCALQTMKNCCVKVI